jgi:hypothetical protein
MKRCPKCGARNDNQVTTCSLCGVSFKAAGDDPLSYEPRLMKGGVQTHRGEVRLSKPEPVLPPPGPPREDMRGERHYLLLPVGEPFKLDAKIASIVLGRDQDAHVKIPSLKASRRHAELRWKDGRVLVRDLGSRNGTWVEGERVDKQRVLEDGETMRLGDMTLTYRFLVPGEELRTSDGPADTVVDEVANDAVAAATPRGIQGELVFLGVGELLRKLGAYRVSGTIVVETGVGSQGHVVVRAGVPAEASYAALEGPVAIQALASLKRGTFKFEPDPGWRGPATTGAHPVAPEPGR